MKTPQLLIASFLEWILLATAAAVPSDVAIALSWGNTTTESTLLIMTCHSHNGRHKTAQDCCSAMTRAAEAILADHPEEQSLWESLTTEKAAANCEELGSLVPNIGLPVKSLRFIYQADFPKGVSSPGTFVWPSHSEWQQQVGETQSKDTVKATFQSVLSQSGGMHRTMDHQLTLPQAGVHELEAFFLILVPSDMFIDAEDAFDEHRWKVNGTDHSQYTLELQSGRVMDIEQPSFGSPQHAVVARLRATVWNLNANEAESLTISFATKIHLRYPHPATSSSSLYQTIALVPPVLMGGTMSSFENRGISIAPEFPNGHLLQFLFGSTYEEMSERKEVEFLTTQVASAPQDDFVWVASLTVLFSILGAAFLGYETSRMVLE